MLWFLEPFFILIYVRYAIINWITPSIIITALCGRWTAVLLPIKAPATDAIDNAMPKFKFVAPVFK